MASTSENDDEPANRLAFYFFLSTLGFALLGMVWMLIQMTFF